ncbi:MAG TPA: hypothetical protein VHS53_15310 [Mucilaginibacter sp.]|nr:hypothetical protein [Mucilaginibacter sp.]
MLAGCSSVYKNLQPATGDINDLQKFKPDFRKVLYKAEIDVVGHHLSGLLFIKTLPDSTIRDSTIRMVFSTETGFKFFDFGFGPDGGFKVFYVVKQMNKKAVIKTLKKDFELILLPQKDYKSAYLRKDDSNLYYIFPRPKGTFCYITDLKSTEMKIMEISSPYKPIVQAIAKGAPNGIPDTIGISHKNFNFTIGLKKIDR